MADIKKCNEIQNHVSLQNSKFESTIPKVAIVSGVIRRDMDLFRDGKFMTPEFLKETKQLLKRLIEENE